jgi:hypothetical protein
MCLASQLKCKHFKMNDLHVKTASCGANPVTVCQSDPNADVVAARQSVANQISAANECGGLPTAATEKIRVNPCPSVVKILNRFHAPKAFACQMAMYP